MIIKLVETPLSPNIAGSILILNNGEIYACEKEQHELTKFFKKIIKAETIIIEKTEVI